MNKAIFILFALLSIFTEPLLSQAPCGLAANAAAAAGFKQVRKKLGRKFSEKLKDIANNGVVTLSGKRIFLNQRQLDDMVGVLNAADDDVAKALKAGNLDKAMEGLAKTIADGADPDSVKQVLNNKSLAIGYPASAFSPDKLLNDLGVLSDKPGFPELLKTLKNSNPDSARGFRLELEYLASKGSSVVEANRKFVSHTDEALSGKVSGSDLDGVILEQGKKTYIQCKVSAGALKREKDVETWVSKCLAEMSDNDPPPTTTRLKYVFPQGVQIPPKIKKFLDDNKIGIEFFPFTP